MTTIHGYRIDGETLVIDGERDGVRETATVRFGLPRQRQFAARAGDPGRLNGWLEVLWRANSPTGAAELERKLDAESNGPETSPFDFGSAGLPPA